MMGGFISELENIVEERRSQGLDVSGIMKIAQMAGEASNLMKEAIYARSIGSSDSVGSVDSISEKHSEDIIKRANEVDHTSMVAATSIPGILDSSSDIEELNGIYLDMCKHGSLCAALSMLWICTRIFPAKGFYRETLRVWMQQEYYRNQ